jgi:hypothetical protein
MGTVVVRIHRLRHMHALAVEVDHINTVGGQPGTETSTTMGVFASWPTHAFALVRV